MGSLVFSPMGGARPSPQAPDVLVVLLDGAVAGEVAALGVVHHGLAGPVGGHEG